MSYCRFGEGDVYVFVSSTGIECCGCGFGAGDFVTRDAQAMVDHLLRHRLDRGHSVPQDAIDRLTDPADAAENAAIWAKRDAEATR